MKFESTFASWLAAALSSRIGDHVKALAFNLYEPAFIPGVKFGIELIGASFFDEDDLDWPCEEAWEPEIRGIDIPESFSGSDWESCLPNMKTLVINHLEKDNAIAPTLKAVEGVGIGFVDGDLEILWKR
jgi:hypothetical protein